MPPETVPDDLPDDVLDAFADLLIDVADATSQTEPLTGGVPDAVVSPGVPAL